MTNSKLHRNALASALALALFAPLAAQAQAQTQTPPPEQTETQQKLDELKPEAQQSEDQTTPPTPALDTVVVTGSRIKRVDVEGPAPVTVITGAQLQAEGHLQVYDALTKLTEATGTVEGDVQWGSHTPNASPLNLRNMGPGRSLLLVNGHRVADYPLPYGGQSNFANYGSIPTAAVDRIEVLAGGASVIYGSDAVAGVVNVILKQGYEGNELRARAGTSTEGGRDTYDLSWVGGTKGDQWSLTYALQWTRRDPLFGRDRPEMDDASDAPRSSWNPSQIAIGFRPSVGINLRDVYTGERLAPPAGACDRFGGEYFLHNRQSYNRNTGAVSSSGYYCGKTSSFSDWLLNSGSEDTSAYLYGTWDFDDNLQAWASLAVYDAEGEWGTSPPSGGLMGGYPDFDYAFYDPTLGRVLGGARQFTPAEVGGDEAMRNHNQERSWDFTAGLRGGLGERFDWDLTIGRAEYEVKESLVAVDFDLFNNFFLGPVTGTYTDGDYSFAIRELNQERWWNPITPDEFRSISTHSINRSSSFVNQASFTLSGDLFDLPAGPLGFAGVIEFAKQGYRLNPDPNGQKDYWVWNIDRGGGERTRRSFGVEFRIPLLESLTTTVATRFDKYSGYKAYDNASQLHIPGQGQSTANVGFEWRPLSNLMFRGSYATSFRAPDMHYLLAQPSFDYVTTTDDYQCIQSGAYLVDGCGQGTPYRYLMTRNRRGTPDLDSEVGDSWTYGFVWDVIDNLSLTADYWKINLEGEIRDIDADGLIFDEAGCRTGKTTGNLTWSTRTGLPCEIVLQRVVRTDDANPDIDRIERGPVNIAEKHVAGIDASLRYRLPTTRWGEFNVGINYTNVLSWQERNNATQPMPELRDREIRSKVRGSVSWQGERWNATVYGDRIGSVPGVRYHFNANEPEFKGGCLPFPDGGVPNDHADCVDTDPNSPTFGQQTAKYFGRVGPAITWNFNVGYKFTDGMKLSLYVNNVFNSTGWNHKDPFKLDYEFYNSRLFNPVGREVQVEYVWKF